MAFDFADIDLQKVDTWPAPLNYLVCSALAVLIVAGGWYFVNSDQDDELTRLENQETQLRQEFSEKARQAVNLDQYKEQIIELESLLDAQLRQLPNSNEVANLLDDISFIAQDNGLNLVSIKWEPEQEKEIYTELPMSIYVTGTYEQLGSFSADIAALPRIVTIDQFSLAHVESKGKDNTNELLEMKMLAKTFRYNADAAKKASERRNRRGR